MNILESKMKEISNIIKNQEDSYECYKYVEQVLNEALSNYLESDVERLIDIYEIRNYIIENRIDYINKKKILPVRRKLMINKDFDYKVFMILKLLANDKQNNIITKFILRFNRDKILNEYNISEKDFIKGFNSLISLEILKEEDTYYKIQLKKNEGYYLLLDRDICIKLSKENDRVIKTYLFMRDFLRDKNNVWNNAKGIINYGIINNGTGYKDTKTLKDVIDRLIDLDLIKRKKIRTSDRIHYEYEILDSTLLDYLPE